MERSSLRRSATRMIFPASSPRSSELNRAVAEFQNVARQTSTLAESERAAADALLKWSIKEDNTAIRDVVQQCNELFGMWAECQKEFSRSVLRSVEHLSALAETEKTAAKAEKRLKEALETEKKMKKELKKAEKWKKGGDVRLAQHKLQQAQELAVVEDHRVTSERTETAVVKMMRLRSALESLADCQIRRADDAQLLFAAQMDLAKQVPALSTEDPRRLRYTASDLTRERVDMVRRQLGLTKASTNDQRRRASAPPLPYDPPPPYAPRDCY